MSRVAHRLFSSHLAVATRSHAHRATFTRRMMSSESHAGHSSDRPWIIGSALVFGPLFLYLVSPSARKDHHTHADHDHGNKSHHDERQGNHAQHEEAIPIADDEGTEVSGEEVKESIEKAFEADVPKDTPEREEAVATATVEENSVSTPQLNPTPVVVPVEVDVATQATGDEKTDNTTAL